ncbi:MAG: GNAT family N-acetyltransferase, partial [Promethearchaeota archaeon]
MKCARCDADAVYRCALTGTPVCLAHARLAVTATRSGERGEPLTIRPAGPADRTAIGSLALYFWDETDVDCFEQCYDVRVLSAFVAQEKGDGEVVGCLSYAVEADTMTVVMLNVLPSHQGRGAGAGLIRAAVDEARAQGLTVIRVATTNDDLLALALYQRHGFRLTGLLPGLVADHHGEEL